MGKPVVIGGHDILAVERFRDETRHMIVYDVLETEPPYPSIRLTPPQIPRPAPRAMTRFWRTPTADVKNAIKGKNLQF